VNKRGFTTNNVENFFNMFKRGVYRTFHHISEQHLQRYLNEFSFRYSERAGRGVSDTERAALTLKGIEGKRLTYGYLARITNKKQFAKSPSQNLIKDCKAFAA
jgi:hypothetical protein